MGFGLANTSLGLAVGGELVAPVLLPVCGVLLVGSNLDTFRAAGQQLCRGRFGLPLLYTCIVAATLATGQFIASAAMSWMLIFWRRRYHNELTHARHTLLGQLTSVPHVVRLAISEPGSAEVELPIDHLKKHDVILVSAGELIPADGLVVQGHGLVDERVVRGTEGLVRKDADDEVFAGSTLCRGELRIKVLRHGPQTRAAELTRAMLAAIAPPLGTRTPTLRGEKFAEQTILPTMAIAGLGLLVGDASTAGAILRPDYASGPGLAFPFETLQAVALCIRHGIVIRNPESLERLATVDLLLLDHDMHRWRNELEVGAVQAFPGHTDEECLRYAATAFHDLDDDRTAALKSACRDRAVALLHLRPIEYATDVTLVHGNDCIKVGDLGASNSAYSGPCDRSDACQPERDRSESLMIGINGRVAGLIHFRRSVRFEAASTIKRLRSKRKLRVGIISEQPHASLASLAESLGVDFHLGDQSPEDRIRFLERCRQRGLKVAYVGNCRVDPRAVALAHVAISLAESAGDDLNHGPAPIWLLEPRMLKLGELWDIAHTHRRRLRAAQGYALIPNILCIAGAFVWGFTSLASVLVTNLGTYSLYSRTVTSLRGLEHQVSRSLHPRLIVGRERH